MRYLPILVGPRLVVVYEHQVSKVSFVHEIVLPDDILKMIIVDTWLLVLTLDNTIYRHLIGSSDKLRSWRFDIDVVDMGYICRFHGLAKPAMAIVDSDGKLHYYKMSIVNWTWTYAGRILPELTITSLQNTTTWNLELVTDSQLRQRLLRQDVENRTLQIIGLDRSEVIAYELNSDDYRVVTTNGRPSVQFRGLEYPLYLADDHDGPIYRLIISRAEEFILTETTPEYHLKNGLLFDQYQLVSSITLDDPIIEIAPRNNSHDDHCLVLTEKRQVFLLIDQEAVHILDDIERLGYALARVSRIKATE